tara:strand:+ start:548 stop:790 length:243 start_codon:yes stop_codon:yes gene_type:complete
MTWNNKPQGNTGKGSKNRSDREKVSKQMEIINNSEPKVKRCSSCDSFKGVKITGHAICKLDVNWNINKEEGGCEKWNRNR